jgi:hypothetical protein
MGTGFLPEGLKTVDLPQFLSHEPLHRMAHNKTELPQRELTKRNTEDGCQYFVT